jgi:hypothetical protein
VAAALEQTDFGVICLTAANLDRPWLLFEAGALAKRLDVACVVPLCIDLTPADVTMPLASFQGRTFSEEGVLRLVTDLNAARENPLPSGSFEKLFKAVWPDLQNEVVSATHANPSDPPQSHRGAQDVMGELVETVRRIERRIDNLPSDSISESVVAHLVGEVIDATSELWRIYNPPGGQPIKELARVAERFRTIANRAAASGLPVPRSFGVPSLEPL